MSELGVNEGDVCNRDGCDGLMWLPPVKDCSCHISPPCSECERNEVRCGVCGGAASDDAEYISPEAQKLNDAMERDQRPERCVCGSTDWNRGGPLGAHCIRCNRDLVFQRGDYLRDRAKDERSETRKGSK